MTSNIKKVRGHTAGTAVVGGPLWFLKDGPELAATLITLRTRFCVCVIHLRMEEEEKPGAFVSVSEALVI